MALNLGSPEAEIIDIIYRTDVDETGINRLVEAAKKAEQILSKTLKGKNIVNKDVMEGALKSVKAKEQELELVKKLQDAYVQYRKAMSNSNETLRKSASGYFRNVFMDSLAQLKKLGRGADEAAKELASTLISAEYKISDEQEKAVRHRQRVLDHYYDQAIKRQKEVAQKEKERLDYRLKNYHEFEKAKEKFSQSERDKELKRLKTAIMEEHKAQQKANKLYYNLQKDRLRFDLKAHNTRLHFIEAERAAQSVAGKRMAWGYTPQEARRSAKILPTAPSEFEGIHSTDLKTFGHKVLTTFEYGTAGVMFLGVLRTLGQMKDAIIDFNKYAATMSAIFRIDTKESKALATSLQHLGTVFGGQQKDIYEIALALGRAGVATKDLTKASEVVIRMAYLTGDSFKEATDAIITYSEVYGRNSQGGVAYSVQELGDKLAYVANVSRLSTEDIGIFSNYALGAAKAVGLTVDAVGAMAAAFSNAGMNASTIGTQIRRFTTLLSDQTTSVKDFFQNVGVSQAFLRQELAASADGTVEGMQRSNEALRHFAARLASLSNNEFVQFTAGMDLLARNSLTFLRQEASAFSTYLDGSLHKANGLLAESDKILQSYIVTWEKLGNTISAQAAKLGNLSWIDYLSVGVQNLAEDFGAIPEILTDAVSDPIRAQLENDVLVLKKQLNMASHIERYGSPAERAEIQGKIKQLKKELELKQKILEVDTKRREASRTKEFEVEAANKVIEKYKIILELQKRMAEAKAKGFNKQFLELRKEVRQLQSAIQDLAKGANPDALQKAIETYQKGLQASLELANRQGDQNEVAALNLQIAATDQLVQSLHKVVTANKAVAESTKKVNQKVEALKKQFRETRGEWDKFIAQTAYLKDIKLSALATMVSQLVNVKDAAYDALVYMDQLAKVQYKRMFISVQEELLGLQETLGRQGISVPEVDISFMKGLVGGATDLQATNVQLATAQEYLGKINQELGIAEQRQSELKELQSHGSNITDKQKEELKVLTEKVNKYKAYRPILKDIITILTKLSQSETQVQKAHNAVNRSFDETNKHATEFVRNLEAANKELKAQLTGNKVADTLTRQARKQMQALRDEQIMLQELLKKREENRRAAEAAAKTTVNGIKATKSDVKAIKDLKDRLKEVSQLMRVIEEDKKTHTRLLSEKSKRALIDRIDKALSNYGDRLNVVQLKLQGVNAEQDKYKILLDLANKAEKKGLTERAEALKVLHDQLIQTDRLSALQKKVDPIVKKYNPFSNIEEQQAALDEWHEAMREHYKGHIDRLKEIDEQYLRGKKVLADKHKKIAESIFGTQEYFAKIATDRMKESFQDFFDYTSDGFLKWGNLAENILHDVYMQMIKAQIVNPIASTLGNSIGSVMSGISGGKVTPHAKGGVLSGPIAFPMKGGTGIAGEAGPEAIMPLTRINGSLGVRSVAPPVYIEVKNETGLPIDMKEINRGMGDNGEQIISVVIEHAQTDPQFREIMGINT